MERSPEETTSTPRRLSLRDYQRELAERLRQADSTRSASKLGVQVGSESWLIDLVEAGEVIPVPPITGVPLTRSWFRGVANVRGNLYSVVDFAAFVGVGNIEITDRARLVLLGDRLRSAAALLVDRSLGLRNPAQLRMRPAAGERAGWVRAEYDDESGGRWRELDVRQLVQHEQFLSPGQ
jgi:twitching motility protein PilI